MVIVKPGGTGRPALVISARPEPLPPSRSFIVRSPSALPPPKKYTYFVERALAGAAFFTLFTAAFALAGAAFFTGAFPAGFFTAFFLAIAS